MKKILCLMLAVAAVRHVHAMDSTKSDLEIQNMINATIFKALKAKHTQALESYKRCLALCQYRALHQSSAANTSPFTEETQCTEYCDANLKNNLKRD